MQHALHKLQTLLQQLFRTDAADLDFGIYRILNYRRDHIQAFIDEELPTLVQNILDDTPQTQDPRAAAVFNHLWTFFSRYADTGDFIPRRRYSQTERYAIPYNGEEVYLHWANKDQYYVKSGEHFATYRFNSQGISVAFDLRRVDIEKDNVKGAKRFYVPLSAETHYSPETNAICIPFEYRPLTETEKKRYTGQKQQHKIIAAAEPEILKSLTQHPNALAALAHTTKGETTLRKHLRTYTRRNTADFFIHKALKAFLTRELDTYIKSEVIPVADLMLTDVNANAQSGGGGATPSLTHSKNWLETAKLVHNIATHIIDFLSHIEEFQKQLWLKKKFVLSTDYCITLDRVPEALYAEIAQNTAQLEAWKDLFAIHDIDRNLLTADYTEPLSVDFLKANPNLVLDTCYFDSDVKDRLLSHFDDLDTETDGLLIHGENFQALNLLTTKYHKSIKAIYIDPPYNTAASEILYKNNYKDSSWMSLMADRLALSQKFLQDSGILCAAIDDAEAAHLRLLLHSLFEKENELAVVAVCSNPAGRQRPTGFAPAHEYALFFGRTAAETQVGRLQRTVEQLEHSEVDEQGRYFTWKGLRSGGGPNALRGARPRLFYPLFVKNEHVRIPDMEWDGEARHWKLCESPGLGETIVLPIKTDGEEMTWGYGVETLQAKLSETRAKTDRNGNISISVKRYLNEAGMLPKTWWGERKYSSTVYGTIFLTNMIGNSLAFMFPKSIYLVEDCLRVSSLDKNDTVLDYFGGSGTTAHATINLNRQDSGNRKYILVEMGHHFDTVLKPRILKAVYAEKWKDAKPVSRESRLPQIIKYQRIESYEDALNNIEFTARESPLFTDSQLSYPLDVETWESQTYLNVAKLQTPFSYELKIVKDMQTYIQAIDVPETFNYLLGVCVQTRQCLSDANRRYLVYRGSVGGKRVVIIWRETEGWGSQDWERDYQFIEAQHLRAGADIVYVNTDSLVPEAEPLDPLFKRLMFSQ